MSAKVQARDFARGQVKKLRRMKQPLALTVLIQTKPRNPVVRAAAYRAVSGAAGKHVRSQGALRRADKVALDRMVRGPWRADQD